MTVVPLSLRYVASLHTDNLKKMRNLALGTLRNYQSTYHTLAAHLETRLGREAMTTDITPEVLEDYFAEYVAAKSPKAWEMKRSHFIEIVKWLMRKGHMVPGINFAEDIPLRKVIAQRPRERRLSDGEFFRLLEVAKRSHNRDYFLCLFIRFTGRRISEVCGSINEETAMHWGDVRWDDDYILWDNFKARRHGRKMPLTPRVRAILEAWRVVYAKEIGIEDPADVPNDWHLFPALTATGEARKGHPRKRVLSPRHRMTNANRVIRPLLEAAGLYADGDGWHVLRKTFANQRKQLASNTGRADAWELTKISLDHTSESTTRRYVNEDDDYNRYAVWAMESAEMGLDAMAKIPELSALAAASALDTQKAPASDAREADQVDNFNKQSSNLVNFASFASRRRALG